MLAETTILIGISMLTSVIKDKYNILMEMKLDSSFQNIQFFT